MPQPQKIAKAFLQEIKWNNKGKVVREGPHKITVQFNPETLKVALSNQIAGDDNKGGSAIQFSSRGTTKLTFDIWFDVTAPQPDQKNETDVRRLTKEIAAFMQTKTKGSGDDTKYIPPGVRFQWGSFLFEGIMESMNESLEFFSEEGKPLRASVSVSLTKQDVEVRFPPTNADAANVTNPGTQPQAQSQEGETVQAAVARQGGNPENWQLTAQLNGIEDSLRVAPGTPINMAPPGTPLNVSPPGSPLNVTASGGSLNIA
jgi:hypothetical protein